MNHGLDITLAWSDWLTLFGHYVSLSLLSVGGAISTAPEMHRFLVEHSGWLTDAQFTTSIALAQAAPGPNVLFIALLGWHVGLNAGGMLSALFGALVTMVGMLLPSTMLVHLAAGWGHRNRTRRPVRAFKLGMAPIVIALVLATGLIIAGARGGPLEQWRLWLVTITAALIIWRTRLHLLWLLGAGALLGALGLI